MQSLLETFKHLANGGWSFVLIVLTGVALVFIALERMIVLYTRMLACDDKTLVQIRDTILKRNYTGALHSCQKGTSPDLEIIRIGLLAVDSGREAMKSSLAAGLLKVVKICENRLSYIALISSAATILGLLGTIMGLVKTFSGLANADPAEKARLLGGGIAEAMYSTGSGLAIALVAMVVHTVLTAKAEHIINRTQNIAFNLMSWIEKAERVNKGA